MGYPYTYMMYMVVIVGYDAQCGAVCSIMQCGALYDYAVWGIVAQGGAIGCRVGHLVQCGECAV